MRVQFGIGAYEHRSKSVGHQLSVNCYLEQEPQGTKNPIALLGCYGIEAFATAGTGSLRGGLVVDDVPYVVAGSGLYRIEANGSATLLGTIPNSDRVTMAGDGTNIMVTTNREGYVWDGSTVAEIADEDFPGADWVLYLDTYFVIGIDDQIWISGNFAPKNWNALDFASAESSPDSIVGAVVEKRELFIGGKDSFEVWYNDGSQDFPLQRTGSGSAEIGLLSKFGLVKYDNSIFFPATDFTVRRMDGYTPLIISKPDLSQMIEDLTPEERSQLYGLAWAESGHLMYALTSPRWTRVYDTLTQEWHTRKSENHPNWRALFVLSGRGRMLVGDRLSNRIGSLSGNYFREWDNALSMVATAQVRHHDNREIIAGNLELVFEAGVGTTGQGENPVVGLRQSYDDGNTWGSQRFRPLGRTGQRNTRAKWSQMGQARSRLLEFSISDPVRRSLLYATLDEEA